MREGIGSTVLYNIIIVFIVLTFGFLAATLSYMKSFKVNSKITNSIERFEGYNTLSVNEITNALNTIGYRTDYNGSVKCPNRTKNGKTYSPITGFVTNHKYCIYEYPKENGYFIYGVVTYVYMDIPIVGGTFTIPVYSETERIYEFNKK